MRQAGRYMPEYRALRQKHSILELCHHPELAAQVTLQPVERLGVDAAILFADILLPFEPLGLGLAFTAGEGPAIARPIRDAAQVARLPTIEPERDLGYVLEAARLASRALPPGVPLIGFAGAPFTLASYAIEGGSTRSFMTTKRFMYAEPRAWHGLMERLAELVGRYLAAGVPVIHFGTDTAGFLEDFAGAGGDVIGVDWRIPLDAAWERIGPARAIQGNLDPVTLLAPRATLEARVRDVLSRAGGRPGHIFNLGHGVLPDTPVEALQAVVELVHGC